MTGQKPRLDGDGKEEKELIIERVGSQSSGKSKRRRKSEREGARQMVE